MRFSLSLTLRSGSLLLFLVILSGSPARCVPSETIIWIYDENWLWYVSVSLSLRSELSIGIFMWTTNFMITNFIRECWYFPHNASHRIASNQINEFYCVSCTIITKLGASGPLPSQSSISNLFSRLIWKRRSEWKKNRIYNSKMRFYNTALFTASLLLCNLVEREFQGNRPLHLASFQSNFQFITIIYAMSWWFSIKYLLIMWHMLINHTRALSLSRIASSLLRFYHFVCPVILLACFR